MAGEGDNERARGDVADAFRDFGDVPLSPPKQVLCQGHAPGQQVLLAGSG